MSINRLQVGRRQGEWSEQVSSGHEPLPQTLVPPLCHANAPTDEHTGSNQRHRFARGHFVFAVQGWQTAALPLQLLPPVCQAPPAVSFLPKHKCSDQSSSDKTFLRVPEDFPTRLYVS